MLSTILPRSSKRREIVKKILSPKIPINISKNYKSIDQSGIAAIESALRRKYFINSPKYLETEQGRHDLQAHLNGRLDKARKQIVPWLNHSKPLADARILEIGCGTGSDTVAFTEQGAKVIAIDINESSIEVATKRLNVYGLDASFIKANATEAHKLFGGEKFDFIIFYAVLEHMTHQERMAAMLNTWNMLSSGDFWCVVETPNRLWYHDFHTAQLPFFNWLPDELAFQYSRFSPRPYFRELYRENNEAKILHFLRRGRGVSFHEFELTMKSIEKLHVVSSKSIFYRQRNLLSFLKWRFSIDYQYESLLAKIYPKIHRGFFQRNLNLIIRKN